MKIKYVYSTAQHICWFILHKYTRYVSSIKSIRRLKYNGPLFPFLFFFFSLSIHCTSFEIAFIACVLWTYWYASWRKQFFFFFLCNWADTHTSTHKHTRIVDSIEFNDVLRRFFFSLFFHFWWKWPEYR